MPEITPGTKEKIIDILDDSAENIKAAKKPEEILLQMYRIEHLTAQIQLLILDELSRITNALHGKVG